MTTTQTKPTCSRCGNAESVISMDCLKCHYSALVMLYVHKCYRADELDGFRDRIRAKSLADLIGSCPSGAFMTLRIFQMIRVLSHPANTHEDDLKSNVCAEISRYLGAMKGIEKYEKEHGPETYMPAWIGAISGLMKGDAVKS